MMFYAFDIFMYMLGPVLVLFALSIISGMVRQVIVYLILYFCYCIISSYMCLHLIYSVILFSS